MTPPNAGSTAFIDQVSLATAEDAFSDGSFESPVLAANATRSARRFRLAVLGESPA